jgi:competence protein ComFC
MGLLDFLYPKKCVNCRKLGEYLCPDCFSKIRYNEQFICPECARGSVTFFTHPGCQKRGGIDGILSVTNYNNITKKLIYNFKYSPYIKNLAVIISDLMIAGLEQNEVFYRFLEKYNPVIIPIPLSDKRLRQRGYNHSELLSNYVAQYFKLKETPKILKRIKETKPQFKLKKDERIKNIANAFGIHKNAKIPEFVILVDDIATSFSTLKEAARVLKRAGVKKVIGITFAREI